ncbi:MAG: GtrA family protein [Candidatus Aenigmatarchaeota archaeon]
MEINLKEISRFLTFAFIGLTGIPINTFFLWFFTEIFKIFYIFSSIIATEITIILIFLLNDFITFRDLRTKGLKNFISRLIQINIIRLFGLLIHITVLFVFTEFFNIYYLISNIFGIFSAFIFNYLLSLWIYKKQKKKYYYF